MEQHLYIANSHIEQPLKSLIHYLNSQFSRYNKLTMISSVFQIANTKPQIPASKNQIRKSRMETKANYTIKIPKKRNSFIYLPTNFEAKTLVLSF